MADPVLDAAALAYLQGRSLPAAPADVQALVSFVTLQAPRLSAPVLHQAEAVADPRLAAQVRRAR